ncbi:hypothetical protein [Bartonella harrusi]|uniref:Uncharacterized protein n=1 Tax=Bartonella harrusi TaxID=2961895 RepID=A0ABY5ET10_9HYPH|nr:hypothetical protein [Bartonella harrusi]UTO28534.1 hypothetical protein NMK50_00365 [Bartonella harrusi]
MVLARSLAIGRNSFVSIAGFSPLLKEAITDTEWKTMLSVVNVGYGSQKNTLNYRISSWYW